MQANSELLEPLQWEEGMMLSPQHFQQNDIYWQQQMAFRMLHSRAYGWGLVKLSLEESLLRQGTIQIKELEAIMPSGSVVQYLGKGEAPSLKVKGHESLVSSNDRLMVYLAIPKRMNGSASSSAELRRYFPVPGGTAVDENTGGTEIQLVRLRTCISLLPADKRSGGYELMPLVEVRRNGPDYALSAYHPPMLRTGAASFLGNLGIANRIEHLVQELVTRATGQSRDARGQYLVQALTAALPALDIMSQSGEVHPFDLYLTLANLMGQVAQLAEAPLNAMNVVPYDHDNLEPCFKEIEAVVERLVKRVKVGFQTAAFRRMEAGVFEIKLGQQYRVDELYVELRGSNRRQLELWMRDAHIGATDLHDELSRYRLPGAGRQAVRDDQARKLPIADGAALFRLRNGNQHTEKGETLELLRTGSTLRISGPKQVLSPDELVLYFKLSAGTTHGTNTQPDKAEP
ncbi:MAG: type VI secretion system baseplate subunit TssK [Gammaproteobacteria bacterium]